jgi:FKBP-type peptidyl-prolyl cis-trans isomerase
MFMKNSNRVIFIMLLAILTLTFTSCLKDTDSKKRDDEKQSIATYISLKGYNVTPTTTGLYYIEGTTGTGLTPTDKDFAIINYTATDLQETLFDATDKALAEQNKIVPLYATGGPLKVYTGAAFIPGISEGIKLMKEGGKAKLIMPSILAYNDYVPRIYNVELVKVISDPNVYEKEQIKNFLDTATNLQVGDSINTNTSRSGITGIYYMERLTGTGTSNPTSGNRVRIRYSGYLPNGHVFDKIDADTAFYFNVGAYNGNVIDGLDEGIRHMKKGGKATIVIPYYRGYGLNQLFSSHYQIVIPYFSTTIFDVELLDIYTSKK